MYPGFPISNILEAASNKIHNIIYQPHYSVFDLCMLSLDIQFHTIDANSNKFFDKNSLLVKDTIDSLVTKSYSLYVSNNPMFSLKNNVATNMHLNSIMFCHDNNLLNLKKEDRFLICENAIRNNDKMYYMLSSMANFNCHKLYMEKFNYCIPDDITIDNNEQRTDIGILCFNKELPDNYISQILNNNTPSTNIKQIPKDIYEAKKLFNKYKAIVELDSGSIINVLWAVACGCIGIIVDNYNILSEYSDIPNLYIISSIEELKYICSNIPNFIEQEFPRNKFIDLNEFKEKTNNIFINSTQKAFLL